MKVFGIGLPRTATSSLTRALNMLGVRTIQFPKELAEDLGHAIIEEYQGFTDAPVPLLYRELDRRHPGSKFIHTVRDESAWLKSVQWLLTTGTVKFKESHERYGRDYLERLFGRTDFDEDDFREVYRGHRDEVARYFAARPNDLLRLDVTAGEGFEKLCPFLGLPVPEAPFPHRNRRESLGRVYGGRLYHRIRRKIRTLLDAE